MTNNNKIHPIAPLPPTEGLEELARELLEGKPRADEGQTQEIPGFIYVPSLKLHIAEQRDLNNLTWEQTIDKIYSQGIQVQGKRAEMPTPFEFMTFLNDLLSGKIPIQEQKKQAILDDILKTGDYRGNHLNTRFIEGTGFNKLNIETHILDSSGKPIKKSEPLLSCLSENCYADIKQINSQGLFTAKHSSQDYQQGRNAYFWNPVRDSVAGFYAVSDGAGLYCCGNPQNSSSALGVRLVVRKKIPG